MNKIRASIRTLLAYPISKAILSFAFYIIGMYWTRFGGHPERLETNFSKEFPIILIGALVTSTFIFYQTRKMNRPKS